MKRIFSIVLAVCLLLSCIPVIGFAEVMTTSAEGVDFIKRMEGFSKYPYWDNSQWTVGYGTRCPNDKLEEYQTVGITTEAALELLETMIAGFESSIQRYIKKYNISLTQNQFDALVSFSFNCGDGWTTSTNGYFNKAIREGATGSEFLYAICLWSRSGGDFILVNRRMCEANMYFNGVYKVSPSSYPENYQYIYLDGNGGELSYIIHGYDTADPTPITYNFKTVPTGIDKNGNTFTYEFAGWFTEDGEQIEVLDETLDKGTVLYAQWKDPEGNISILPKGETIKPVNVTVLNKVNVRKGPGTYYALLAKAEVDTVLTINSIYTYGGIVWGQSNMGWLSLSYTNYEEVAKEEETWPKTGVVNATHVNVRSGPGTEHERMYQLNIGDPVTIHEKTAAGGLDWGRLDDNNWICLTYVTFDEVVLPENPDEPDETPEELPVVPEPTPEPEPEPEPVEPPPMPGDVDGNDEVNKDDAIYLLRYVLFPEKYPLEADGDIDKDGDTDKDDAIYLLRHVLFPDKYPLNNPK